MTIGKQGLKGHTGTQGSQTSQEPNILTVEFPRAFRGYATLAVDDFIRQMGTRLETLQTRLDDERERTEQLKASLNRSNADLAAYVEKESAITNAIVAMEQRRVAVGQELEVERGEAQQEATEILRDARLAAEEIIDNARRNAEETLANARRSAEETIGLANSARALQEDRLRALCAEYDSTANRIRRALEAQLSLLPSPGETLASLSIGGMAVTSGLELIRGGEKLEVA